MRRTSSGPADDPSARPASRLPSEQSMLCSAPRAERSAVITGRPAVPFNTSLGASPKEKEWESGYGGGVLSTAKVGPPQSAPSMLTSRHAAVDIVDLPIRTSPSGNSSMPSQLACMTRECIDDSWLIIRVAIRTLRQPASSAEDTDYWRDGFNKVGSVADPSAASHIVN
eukprot:GHVU01145652.1.p2 GENE.GHVU01145652.1~~GHVU01145652.1.p2  ORF type:complete len:169 (-),score=13.44 GHVU01145652.1:621-1127(-)